MTAGLQMTFKLENKDVKPASCFAVPELGLSQFLIQRQKEVMAVMGGQKGLLFRTDHIPFRTLRIPVGEKRIGKLSIQLSGFLGKGDARIRFFRQDADLCLRNVAEGVRSESALGAVMVQGGKSDRSKKVDFIFLDVDENQTGSKGRIRVNFKRDGGEKVLFDMDGNAYGDYFFEVSLNELAKLCEGVDNYWIDARGAQFHAIDRVSPFTRGCDLSGIYAALQSGEALTIEAVEAGLASVAGAAVDILMAELIFRIHHNDWKVFTPTGCSVLEVTASADLVVDATNDPTLEIEQKGADGSVRTVQICLTSSGAQGGVFVQAVPPRPPLYEQRWQVSTTDDSCFESVSISKQKHSWPMKGFGFRVSDVTSKERRNVELNPVQAALDIISLVGQLSSGMSVLGCPSVPAYGLAWRFFSQNRFHDLRRAWLHLRELIPSVNFSDVGSVMDLYNKHLPTSHHRIFSKHGFSKPLYAKNIGKILDQMQALEEALESQNLRMVLCYGTLLGAVRDKCFILHDDDVDVAIILDVQSEAHMLEKRVSVLDSLRRQGFAVRDSMTTVGRPVFKIKVPGYKGAEEIDLFTIWRTPDGVVQALMAGLRLRALKDDWFREFIRYPFYTKEFWVPLQYKEFLQDRYGDGWVKPDPTYGLR